MAGRAHTEKGIDRVSAGELQVDLREVLSNGEAPSPATAARLTSNAPAPPNAAPERAGTEHAPAAAEPAPPASDGAAPPTEHAPPVTEVATLVTSRASPAAGQAAPPPEHTPPATEDTAPATDTSPLAANGAAPPKATDEPPRPATTATDEPPRPATTATDEPPHPATTATATPAAPPTPDPEPAEVDDPLSTELLPDDIYRIVDGREVRDTVWTRLHQRLHNLLTSPPARQEEQLDRDLMALRVRGLARGVTVALGSIKGGVGKTTLTLALADMLADSLRCGVLVVDADLEWGTAADSTPQTGATSGTLTEVLAAYDSINAPGDLAPYLRALPGGAQLLAGPTDPTEIEQLGASDMQRLLELLRRFFPVILLDLSPGIGLRGTIPRWAFSVSDEIVAIATPTRGSLRRAGRMLSYLGQHRPDVPVTLALNMVPRRPDEAIRRVIKVAEQNGKTRRYAAIPRDDALMRQLDAGLLNIAELDQPTRIAVKDLAYQLASTWCR